MLNILIEDVSPSDVWDFKNEHNYAYNFISDEKVGKVPLSDYYKFEKGVEGKLTYMTANDYINHCIYDIFKSSYEATVTNSVDFDTVDQYAEAMLAGNKFPIPYLNYANRQQEGRHRALAFAQAFGENTKLPVVEIMETDVTLDEIADYCMRKWGNVKSWIEEVALGLGYSKQEVNEYLGIEDEESYDDFEIDEDELNQAFIQDLEDELNAELDDFDYENTVKQLSKKSGKSIKDIENLSADKFAKLLQKYL